MSSKAPKPSNQAEVPPRDAATLLVLRAAGAGGPPELFCVRRHAKSAFMGGVVVFPGGKLDQHDGDPALAAITTGLHPRATVFASDQQHARALAVCACRESLEEAAIGPILPASSGVQADDLQRRLAAGDGLLDLLRERGLRLDTRALLPFARWITPRVEQRRYDARFFMTRLPAGQRGKHDTRETTWGVWATADRLLTAYANGDLFLAPPTIRAFELLRAAADVDSALAICADQSLLPIRPQFVPGDPPMLVLPGDPLHAVPAPRVSGGSRFVIEDGRFTSRSAPA